MQLASAWDPAPLVLAGAAASALLFGRGWVRLRRRGRPDLASGSRLALFAAGLALATLALVSPLDAAGDTESLSAHMLQHLVIGDAGPALLVLAVRGPLLAFVVPAAVLRAMAGRRGLRAAFGALGRPTVAVGAWIVAMALWHVPAAYDAALRHPLLHDAEHLTFAAAGLLVWWQLVDPARHGRLSVAGRAAVAGVVFGAGQVLCMVLLLSPAPLYAAYADAPRRLFGLSALADQQYAGLVMTGEQFLTLGTCVALLGASLLRPPSYSRASGNPGVTSVVSSARIV
jgi:cytochrome c oxidase assembly factor CtaG